MKVIGIEIDNKRVICYALEKDLSGTYTFLNNKFKYLAISNDQENDQLKDFQNSLFTFLNRISADKIAIISRQTKGKFASSSSSFKLEALIQCYENVSVRFVSKPSLNAFYKKNECPLNCEVKYQDNALRLAFFLLNS